MLKTPTVTLLALIAPQLPGQRPKDRLPLPKFSQLVKRMVVEIERNPGAYPDGNVVEVRLRSCDSEEKERSLTSSPVAQSANTNAAYGRLHITQDR